MPAKGLPRPASTCRRGAAATSTYCCSVAGWQAEIVRPLRRVRQLLKDRPWTEALPETVDAARRRVADAELAAEHAEQLKLASLYMPPADRDRPPEKRLRAAVGNLGVYAVCLGVVPDTKDRTAVAAVMKATFPQVSAAEIEKVVGLEPSSSA
jgi:hypothetical protein